jgi:hypothetical protein
MIYFSTLQDAQHEKMERPHLKIGYDFCACGTLTGYYSEYNPITNKYDKVFACDNCYIEAEPIQRK